jgi:phosphoserine phosphatase RsbU/P
MRRLAIACLGLLLLLAGDRGAAAQSSAPAWVDGSVDLSNGLLNNGWHAQSGDNLAWAQPGFDDSAWPSVALTAANDEAGWRWYRLHTEIPSTAAPLALLVTGGSGTYEVYINGRQLPGPVLLPNRLVTLPRTQIVALPAFTGSAVIALRSHIPTTSMFLADRGSFRVALGTLPAIRDSNRADFSTRFAHIAPAMAVYVLAVFAGVPLLFLFWNQPDHREYLWLGLYLLMNPVGELFYDLAKFGFLPFSCNWFIASPSIYIVAVLQIEFTFSFVGQRVTRGWRIYQTVVLAYPAFLLYPAWLGMLSRGAFNVGEIALILPVAVVLPILLLYWYRRGNREAGWLILPSLLPIGAVSLTDAGIIGANFNLPRLAMLGNSVPLGPFAIQPFELGDLLFVLAIGVVMFFRFTRVSREQARSAAELQAAREIQQYLIPEKLPPTPGLIISSVYQPSREVGGDFFQVLPDARDGSTLIVVGDVAGKGLQAGMLAALIVGAIRTAFKFTSDPGKILALLNERLQGRGLVTCLAMRIDGDGNVELANAGHLPPYVDGKELELDGALPLGALPDVSFSTSRIRLSEGQSMLFISDGVIEARNVEGELFGFERMRAISGKSADQIAKAAELFGQEDDITVLTLSFAAKEVCHA